MRDLVEDVLQFMQTGIIPEYTAEQVEEFVEELDLQEQINETEINWEG